MTRTIDEQLTKYLTDAHAIEVQALAQMRAAPDLAGDPELAEAFRVHLRETERHEELVRARLEARDTAPSRIKDLAGQGTGKAFVLFARSQPDTTGKLTAHALAYEHLEWAAYELLRLVARHAGDAADRGRRAPSARRGGRDGRAPRSPGRPRRRGVPARAGLRRGARAPAHLSRRRARDRDPGRRPPLAGARHRARGRARDASSPSTSSRRHAHRATVERLLDARGGKPSAVKDAALRLGSLNWGAFFAAQPDTPAKLAGFAHAFEFLEVGAYSLLARVAVRADDAEVANAANAIAGEERAAADRIAAAFDGAVDASLRDLGVTA